MTNGTKGTEMEDSVKHETLMGYKNIGRFYVGPHGDIVGPEGYMKSESFKECKRRIENGTHVLIGGFPMGTDTPTMLGVIFQTDYAAWAGMQEMMAWGKR